MKFDFCLHFLNVLIIIIIIIFVLNLVGSKSSSSSSSSSLLISRKKQLPGAIIIGAKKCGTRALIKFIGNHPNVTTAGAETHFFDRFYHMGLHWYKNQMPLSAEHHQLTIEKTPKYFVEQLAPARVHRMNPNVKLILVVRDPVTRAISEFVQSQLNKQQNRINSQTFAKLLYENATTTNDTSNSTRRIRADWPIVRNGLYVKHLRNWLKYFPMKQILIVNGERLIREPSVEIQRLEMFLNLEQIIKPKHFVFSKRKRFACILEPLESNQIKCLSSQKGRPHPRIDEQLLNDLKEFYRPYDQMLFDLIGEKPWW